MIFEVGNKVIILDSRWGSLLEVGSVGTIAERREFTDRDLGRTDNYYYSVSVPGQDNNWFHRYDELELVKDE